MRPGASARRATRRRLLMRATRKFQGSWLDSHKTCTRMRPYLLRAASTLPQLRARVRVPRLLARPVVDYFAHTVRPGPTARRATRCRLLRIRHASGCLGSSLTTLPTPRVRVPRLVVWLVVDYFSYVVRSGASARHAARRRPHTVSPLDFLSVQLALALCPVTLSRGSATHRLVPLA
jgi:hypothetical protein